MKTGSIYQRVGQIFSTARKRVLNVGRHAIYYHEGFDFIWGRFRFQNVRLHNAIRNRIKEKSS